ncbi:MAG: tetratricopeptide repeat protein [Candidatus Aceula meridiana]|nr:tetratricopeptide repeat protein [Candidatus Aceula meridiana]
MIKKFSSYIASSLFLKIIILLVVGFILYSFMLASSFKVLDDQFSILENPYVRNFNHASKAFAQSFFLRNTYYRPLVTFSFAVENHFFGLNPVAFNLTNVILHLATSIIILLLMSLILKDSMIAFWIAFLFMLHPVHTEAVSNIAGRSILLCALFQLATFLFYVLFQKRRKALYYILAVLCFALALLSKESAIMLPAVLLAYNFFFCKDQKRNLIRLSKPLVGFAGVVVFYLSVRKILGIVRLPSTLAAQDFFLGIITFWRALFTYFRILILPVDLHPDRLQPVFRSFFNVQAVATLLGWGGFLFVLAKFYKRFSRRVLFFMSFAALAVFPVSQVFPLRPQAGYIMASEHFFYMPAVGLLALVVLGLRQAYKKITSRKLVSPLASRLCFLGWVIFLSMITAEQNLHAVNEAAMLKRSLRYQPFNARIHASLGFRYAKLGSFKQAEKHFRAALSYDEKNMRSLIGLGASLIDQGRYWEGLAELEKVQDPSDLRPVFDSNRELGYRRVMEGYQKRLLKEPNNAQLLYSMGVVYSKTDKHEEAIAKYKKALSLDPGLRNALFNLCSTYGILNREEEAHRCYEDLELLENN